MKEAIVIDLDGFMTDVTLVADEVTGVFPIYAIAEPNEEGQAVEPVLVGYRIAIRPPEGLYKLKFDLDSETWGEGLTQEELDAIQNTLQPETQDQKIVRLESELAETNDKLANTEISNLDTMDALFDVYITVLDIQATMAGGEPS
ncbi:hypothetical protein [Paenibacillus agricola]|uniref:Uncharacterized protein n=1 Tax=Paenibacillus agricola TaxID=2716264 RepID=A0ABX0J0E5_9BACL|nr:hypothetical protein [Paenibacillus agricola]NHN29438.1 hypothetical protein [Paenibacillus agricola]